MATEDRNWNVVLPDAPETGVPEEAPETFDEVDDASIGNWWACLPDFMKADYPFDLRPARMPFTQKIFTECGAPARCPQQPCRRSMPSEGGDGPPCFRADREPLHRCCSCPGWSPWDPQRPRRGTTSCGAGETRTAGS